MKFYTRDKKLQKNEQLITHNELNWKTLRKFDRLVDYFTWKLVSSITSVNAVKLLILMLRDSLSKLVKKLIFFKLYLEIVFNLEQILKTKP